jgi:hypothetical protein
MDRKRKKGAENKYKEEESRVEERSKEWIERGREEQRIDRKRKRGAKNG